MSGDIAMKSPNSGNLLLRNIIIVVVIVVPENLVRLQLLMQGQCCQKWTAQHRGTGDGRARTRKTSHICVRMAFRLPSYSKRVQT